MKKTIRIATYNIQHAIPGEEKIAAVLRELRAAVVGVQEVDFCNSRSGGRDQPALLAALSGMPYYRFAPAIDFRGGTYGTLILSKYPVLDYETIPLPAGNCEGRAVGHAVLDVSGTRVDFFNTHLSYEQKSLRAAQFDKLAALVAPCRRYIVTGDFNTDDFAEFSPVGAPLAVNRQTRRIVSFPGDGSAIDNILCSAGFAEIEAGRVEATCSDHHAVFATVAMEP